MGYLYYPIVNLLIINIFTTFYVIDFFKLNNSDKLWNGTFQNQWH